MTSNALNTWTRPDLYPRQRDAIFCNARIAVVEASTKSGKTVGCLVWLLEQAFLHGAPGRHYWWVAPVKQQAEIAFKRAIQFTQSAGGEAVLVARRSDMTLTLPNGAVIAFKSGERPDDLYGEDVYAAVLDEATRMREETWHAVRSTLTATEGPVRIIGNVKGRKNWAYRLARLAEAGEPDMHYAKMTAYDAVEAGVLTEREVEAARRQLPEDVFKELYLAEPSDEGSNPFGIAAIRDCVAPLSTAEPVCWGWDLGKAVSFTAGVPLDRDGAMCGFERFQLPWEETGRRIASSTGRTAALIDSTGVGDPIVERLQRERSNFEGFKFTTTSRQQLLEGLAIAIQEREIRIADVGPLVAELESCEFEHTTSGVRYAAPDGLHDDCVMALALAVRHWRDRGKRTWGVYDPLDGLQDGYLVDEHYIDTDTGVAPSPQLVGKKVRYLG